MTDGGLEPSGFFVLRTPLLPFEDFHRSVDSAGVQALAQRPDVADALSVASPALVDALGSDRAPGAVPKLSAYLTRAATRCTPFGLFAGCTVGRLGASTRLELCEITAYHRHTRLDNDYLFALVMALEADPALRPALRWHPNSSLYRAGGRWRYAEARVRGTLRSYHLVAVDDSDALATVLACARRGATVHELASSLVDEDIDLAEAAVFIGELIGAQLLVSDLQLQVTGPEPLDTLIKRLSTGPVATAAATRLAEVRSLLARVDAGGPGAPPEDYGQVATLLDGLPAPVERGRLLQVDMVKPAVDASLGPAVVGELARAIEVLHDLWRRPDSEGDLARFRDAFAIRFENQEVPLVEALDEELGIGFGSSPLEDTSSPLLAGLDFPPPPPEPGTWTKRDELLLAMVESAVLEGRDELQLEEGHRAALAGSNGPDRPPLPDAVEVIATLAARSAAAVDGGEFRLVVHAVSGPPGARLLGRFCHADGALHRLVLAHLRQEEACRPDTAFAEIAHLPEGRLGNILCRPVLRPYEIPYLTAPGAAPEAQIPISDLTVSVRGGQVVLRSQRLDREVLPRLTTAHNFGYRTLGLYRFLCALQGQGVATPLAWTWGPLAGSPFLPRVVVGRLVLARAQWTLRDEELTDLPRDRLPRLVVLADGDNQLVCDLDAPLSVEALRQQLKGRDRALLTELLPGPDELCVSGPEGRFVHEIVVPFVRTATSPSVRDSSATGKPATVRRRFPPGSEWLYAKLFTGTATADGILLDAVRPLVNSLLAEGLADSWFFVRYGDGGWHVRLRVHGDAPAMLARLHDAMEPLLAGGRVWRVQLDTYEREVERYGGDAGMELSETVFRHDSDAVVDLLALLSGDEGLDARWRLALAGTDRLLDDLGLTLAEKVDWASARRAEFAAEFRADTNLHRQLGRRYRAERPALEELLAAGRNHPFGPGLDVLARRSLGLAAPAAELRRRGLPIGRLAASYAHMYANRLLRSGHRAQELVLHDLLYRLYQAQLHRG